MQLSGLVKGSFDWHPAVQIAGDTIRLKANKLEAEKATLNTQRSAIVDIESKITALQTSLTAIKDSTLFQTRTASLKNNPSSPKVSVKALPGALTGSYTFDITQLATATVKKGQSNIANKISNSNDVSGVTLATMNTSTAIKAGTFTVNNAQITIAATDSLQDVFTAINTATGGQVTAAYDSSSDKITLSRASTIILGSAGDTSNFLQVTKLFYNDTGTITSATALGSLSLTNNISASGLDSSSGHFTINGKQVDYNSTTDSFQKIMQKVNTSGAGVNLYFDHTNNQFILKNLPTGSLGIGLDDTGGGLLQAMGLLTGSTTTLGTNASFTVNGGATFTSNSNTFTEDAHGVTGLFVTATDIGSETIDINADASAAKSHVEDFIKKYNELQSLIKIKTASSTDNKGKVTKAALTENHEVGDLSKELRTQVFAPISGLNGPIQRLADIGIDFQSTGELAIKNPATLNSALKEDSDLLTQFFTDTTSGFAKIIGDRLATYSQNNGSLKIKKNSIDERIRRIDPQIESIAREAKAEEEKAKKKYIAMDKAMSESQQQSKMLSSKFSRPNQN